MSTYTEHGDVQTLHFDNEVASTLLSRSINYDKNHSTNTVTITVPDDNQSHWEIMQEMGINDLEDNYLYTRYSVNLNVPENV